MSQWSKQLKVQRYLFSNCPNVQDKWNGDSPVDTIKVHPKNDKPVGGPLRFQIFFCNLFNYFPSTCLKIIFQMICYCCNNWRGSGWSNVWVMFCTQIASSLTSSTWGLWIHFGLYWNHKKLIALCLIWSYFLFLSLPTSPWPGKTNLTFPRAASWANLVFRFLR